MPNAMDTYVVAVQKFQECAAASMENLAKAREAYQEALKASAEIRRILTSQDDSLNSVMIKLQQTVTLHLVHKGDPAKPIEISLEEQLPALLRQIREAEPQKPDRKMEDKVAVTAKADRSPWP